MNWLRSIRTRFRALFLKHELDAEMHEEMRSHIEMRTQANIKAGMNPEEARFAALRQFGWTESIKEDCREQRGVTWLENLVQDIRYGARQLRKNPGFTAVAVLTLALGIGANTAIFSVVNGVLLKPLPYPQSDRLVWVAERLPGYTGLSVAYPNFADWRAQQNVFERFGCYMLADFVLTGRGDAVQLRGARVSADVFRTLEVPPLIGRWFSNDEDKPGGTSVALLSHSLWLNRFGAEPAIVGQTITLDGRAVAVVGVMPPGFAFPAEVSFWVPIGPMTSEPGWQNRGNHPDLFGVARLKSGVTLEQARSHLDTIATQLEQQYPNSNKDRRVDVERLLDVAVGGVERNLWILFGAVALVLLVACANVANLLSARAASRQKELLMRAALGATRKQILRQMLTESVLLAALGGAAGFLVAQGALRVITIMAQSTLPRVSEIGLDSRMLLFLAATALMTVVLFGLAPAWQASRVDVQNTLREAAPTVAGGRGRLRFGLVMEQISLTLPLLLGAGLLLRSVYHLQQVNPGFVSERVLSFQVDLLRRKYSTVERGIAFYRELLERLRTLPGVQAASLASRIPLDGRDSGRHFHVEGEPEPAEGSEKPYMEVQVVAPDYFRALGISLLQGRDFTERDTRFEGAGESGPDRSAAPNVVIIDEQFARRHWPNQDPLGKRIRLPGGARGNDPVLTVIGIVGRVRLLDLREREGNVRAYLPFLQAPQPGMTVVLKTSNEPSAMVAAARQQVQAIDSEQPIHQIRTLAELRANSSAATRLYLALLSAFAGVALALAAVGLCGVLAYLVTQQRREIGVRIALGAQRGDVLGLVLTQGMKLAGVGILIGLAAAYGLTRLLRALLFGVSPTDPITFLSISLLLAGVACLACWLPARRAAKVDPMEALRYE